MAFPEDPLGHTVELEIDGVWTDITSDVYQRDDLKITRGRSDEAAQVEPSRCEMTINNRSGNYSPRNPLGTYFGILGRNTPVRVKVGASTRFMGEVASWPQQWDLSGNDVWTSIQAAGVLRRLGQGATPLKSVLRRHYTSLATPPIAYWPCEDGKEALSLASGLIGHPPMTIQGAVDLASFSEFDASEAIPKASGATWVGPIPTYTDTGEIQVRFLLAVPEGGSTNGASVCRIFVSSAVTEYWDLTYGTGGTLQLDAIIGGASSLTVGPLAAAANGKLLCVSIELQQNGANVDAAVRTIEVGASTAASATNSTLLFPLGPARLIAMNIEGSMDDVALGHIAVQDDVTTFTDFALEVRANAGETAGRRIERLCTESGVSFTSTGDLDDTEALGPQLPTTLLDLLYEAAASDLGILYEPRDSIGLAYRTRMSLYAQAPALELDYSAADMSAIEPVDDDQATRNDVIVKRTGGSSFREVDEDGPLGTNSPVGRYDEEVNLSLGSDAQLADQASWRLHLGTVDEARYPQVSINLARSNFATDAVLTAAARDLDIGDKVIIANPPAWLPPEDISQLAQGFTEVLRTFEWTIDVNCSPASPWDVAVYDETSGPGEARYSSDGSTLAEDLTTGETAIDVATPTGPLWGHNDGDFDIYIGGERMTVTAVTGASSPQTFTVTRAVNGVVKTHATGDEVRLFKPAYYAL